MERNLSALRQLAYDRLDWAPTASAEQKARTNRAINQALMQLAKDCPNAFFQATGYFTAQPDVVPSLSTDTLNCVSGDAWVLRANLNDGTNGAIDWDDSGQWDGRLLRLTDSNGVVRERRIRQVWKAANRVNISLYTPWVNDTDQGLTYRVFTDAYYFPDDVMQMHSLIVQAEPQVSPLKIIGQDEAEQLYYERSLDNQASGIPYIAYRRDPYGLQAPTLKPEVETLDHEVSWNGPEPFGKFQYVYTYCWGYRNQEWATPGPLTQTSDTFNSGRLEPLWESAPSPVSDTITTSEPGIQITLPDLEFMQGFGNATQTRYHHSGWYYRIYRKRISNLGPTPPLETANAYYLMATLQADTTFVDDGSITPDFHRRLREVHSYQSLALYPRPDAEYSVKIRYTRRPSPLLDEYDVPMVYPDATDSIVWLVVAYLYETQGNMSGRDRAMLAYEKELGILQKRYGDMRPPAIPLQRDLARPRNKQRMRKWWRY